MTRRKFPEMLGGYSESYRHHWRRASIERSPKDMRGFEEKTTGIVRRLFGSLLIGADTKYHTLMLDLGARGDQLFTSTLREQTTNWAGLQPSRCNVSINAVASLEMAEATHLQVAFLEAAANFEPTYTFWMQGIGTAL